MYVERDNQLSSCKYFCRGKPTNITYSEIIFVALFIQHVMRNRHIVK